MKNYYVSTVLVLLTAAMFTSCNNDDKISPLIEGEGNVQLVIADQPMTRAAPDTQTADADESTVANSLEVFIYNENDELEFKNVALTFDQATQKTIPFTISQGPKRLFVFSRRAPGKAGDFIEPVLNDPIESTSVKTLMTNILTTDFIDANNVYKPSDIATSNAFMLSTLWIPAPVSVSTPANPAVRETIDAFIGRAAAKVYLNTVKKGDNSPLKGQFDINGVRYRMASVPREFYQVGHYVPNAAGDLPPATGTQFLSSVHTEPPMLDATTRNPIYVDYDWPTAADAPRGELGTTYYVVENTSDLMSTYAHPTDNYLYLGNTTFIQMRIKYQPDATEIMDATSGSSSGTLPPDGTFFAGTYQGAMTIFDADPSSLGVIDTKQYTEGIMYYNFAIKDPYEEQGTLPMMYCIVRNHCYHVAVNTIFNLGEPDDDYDPQKPIIDGDADVDIAVNVLPWYKIDYGVNL